VSDSRDAAGEWDEEFERRMNAVEADRLRKTRDAEERFPVGVNLKLPSGERGVVRYIDFNGDLIVEWITEGVAVYSAQGLDDLGVRRLK
jgi:hypothetical protein